MNLFTILVELWYYGSRNLCSKKDSFSEHPDGRCYKETTLTLLNNNAGPSQYVRIGKTMVLLGFYRMECVVGSDGRPIM